MEKIVKYGFYDEVGEYCIVLDSNALKVKLNAKKIYLDTEE